jgi:hypothetical protein
MQSLLHLTVQNDDYSMARMFTPWRPQDTVGFLKQRIEELDGYPARAIRLSLGSSFGLEMNLNDDDAPMGRYAMGSNDLMIKFACSQPKRQRAAVGWGGMAASSSSVFSGNLADGNMKIYVKTLTGKTLHVVRFFFFFSRFSYGICSAVSSSLHHHLFFFFFH